MRTGLFSVSYAGLWGQFYLNLEDFIGKAADLGFDGVLLMAKRPHLSVLDADEKTPAVLRKLLEEKKLSLIGLAAYNDFLLQGPVEVPVEEMQISYIKQCCRLCSQLGGEVVRIFTGYEKEGVSPLVQWKKVARLLRECGDHAAEYGVSLAVQNHHDCAVDTASMKQLLEEVGHPSVKAGFDAWSPFLRGEDLYESALMMAPLTVLSIVANYRRFRRYRYRPELINYEALQPDMVMAESMSEGEIDYGKFLRGLREGGYSGPLVYEMCSPLKGGGEEQNLDRKALDFLSFCKNDRAQGRN